MSRQLTGLTLWIAANQAQSNSVQDAFSGRPFRVWRGNRVVVLVALFAAAPLDFTTFVDDLSNLVSAELVIRAGSATGTVLVNKALGPGDINGTLTFDQWIAQTGQQLKFVLDPTDTNWAAQDIWIAIQVTTATSGPITIATGTGTIVEDGIGTAGTPTAADYTAYSKAESDARYPLGSPEGGMLIKNRDTSTLFRVVLTGADNAPMLTVLSNA